MSIKINELNKNNPFHDSILIDLRISADLRIVHAIVLTRDDAGIQKKWEVKCEKVLRFEFETLGDGEPSRHGTPTEIYEIYNYEFSHQIDRWTERLKILGILNDEAKELYNIVFASSFVHGWGENNDLDGIHIICRKVTISEIYD